MNRLLIVCGLLTVGIMRPCGAQEKLQKVVAVQPQTVGYISSLPSSVRKKMPRGAQTCFFGLFRPMPSARRFAVHLFNAHTRSAPKPTHEEDLPHHVVDLFEVRPSSRQGDINYHFIHRFELNSKEFPWSPTKYQVQFYWLNPQQKTQPLLVFNIFAIGECYGAVGHKIVTVFNQGWLRPRSLKVFSMIKAQVVVR